MLEPFSFDDSSTPEAAQVTPTPTAPALDWASQDVGSMVPPVTMPTHRRSYDQATEDANQAAGQLDIAKQIQTQQSTRKALNTVKGQDLKLRGIPTYQNSSGDVAAVTDDTGTPLTGLDSKNGIAWDSKGQPKSISYDPTKPSSDGPVLGDPYAKAQDWTEPKTGNIYKSPAGLAWKQVGTDQTVADAEHQKEVSALNAQTASALGAPITSLHNDFNQATVAAKKSAKALGQLVPTFDDKGQPIDVSKMDGDQLQQHIEDSFNKEYAAPEANATQFFSKDLTPEAQAIRQDIDQRKAAAVAAANAHLGNVDSLQQLGGQLQEVKSQQDTLKAQRLLEVLDKRASSGLPPLANEDQIRAQAQAKIPQQQDSQIADRTNGKSSGSYPEVTGSTPVSATTQPGQPTVDQHGAAQSFAERTALIAAHGMDKAAEGLSRFFGMNGFADFLKNRTEQQEAALRGEAVTGTSGGREQLSTPGTAANVAANVVGGLGAYAPGIVAGGIPGLVAMGTQAMASASAEAHDQVKNSGGSDDQATHAAGIAALKTLPATIAFAGAGAATSKILSKVLPLEASPITRAAAALVTNAGMNVAASSVGRVAAGENPTPSLEDVVNGIVFAAHSGMTEHQVGLDLNTAKTIIDGTHPEMAVMNGIAEGKVAQATPEQQAGAAQYANAMRSVAQKLIESHGYQAPEAKTNAEFTPASEQQAPEKPVSGKVVATKPAEQPISPESSGGIQPSEPSGQKAPPETGQPISPAPAEPVTGGKAEEAASGETIKTAPNEPIAQSGAVETPVQGGDKGGASAANETQHSGQEQTPQVAVDAKALDTERQALGNEYLATGTSEERKAEIAHRVNEINGQLDKANGGMPPKTASGTSEQAPTAKPLEQAQSVELTPEERKLGAEWHKLNQSVPSEAHGLVTQGLVLKEPIQKKVDRMNAIERQLGARSTDVIYTTHPAVAKKQPSADTTEAAPGIATPEAATAEHSAGIPVTPAPIQTPEFDKQAEDRKAALGKVSKKDAEATHKILTDTITKQGLGDLTKKGVIKILPRSAERTGSGFKYDIGRGVITVHIDDLAQNLDGITIKEGKADYVRNALDHELRHYATFSALTQAEIEETGKNLTKTEREALESLYGASFGDDHLRAGAEAIALFGQAKNADNVEAFHLFTEKAEKDKGFADLIRKWLAYAKKLVKELPGEMSARLRESVDRVESVLRDLRGGKEPATEKPAKVAKETALAKVEEKTPSTGKFYIQFGDERIPLGTLNEASRKFSEARDASGMGARDLPSVTIHDETGKQVGYISYNGKVWEGRAQDWKPGQEPIYDPSESSPQPKEKPVESKAPDTATKKPVSEARRKAAEALKAKLKEKGLAAPAPEASKLHDYAKDLGLSYDGTMGGHDDIPLYHQFTDHSKESPSNGASFNMEDPVTKDALAAKLKEKQRQFAGGTVSAPAPEPESEAQMRSALKDKGTRLAAMEYADSLIEDGVTDPKEFAAAIREDLGVSHPALVAGLWNMAKLSGAELPEVSEARWGEMMQTNEAKPEKSLATVSNDTKPLSGSKWNPNSVVLAAHSFPDYTPLGIIQVPHDGTDKGIATAREDAMTKAQEQWGEVSHSASMAGATDETGFVKQVVSPNGNITKMGTPEAKYALGDTNAFKDDALSKILEAKRSGDVDTANKEAQSQIDKIQERIAKGEASITESKAKEAKDRLHFKNGGTASQLDSRYGTDKAAQREYLTQSARHRSWVESNIKKDREEIQKWESTLTKSAAANEQPSQQPATAKAETESEHVSQANIESVSRLAEIWDNQARKDEGGKGVAAGAENISYRWKADALRGMLQDIRNGMSVRDAADKAKKDARTWIQRHNSRSKDINLQRWDGTVDSDIDSAVRTLESKKPEAKQEPDTSDAELKKAEDAFAKASPNDPNYDKVKEILESIRSVRAAREKSPVQLPAKEEAKVEKAVTEAQKVETDKKPAVIAPKVLKAQKEYLIAALDKAIAEAPEERATPRVPADKDIDLAKSIDDPLNKETVDTYTKRRSKVLNELFAKYGVPEKQEAWEAAKDIDGNQMKLGHVASPTSRPEMVHSDRERSEMLAIAMRKARNEQLPSVRIEIPGDGTFTFPNRKSSLEEFKRDIAKRFPVAVAKASEPKPSPQNARMVPVIGTPKTAGDFLKIAAIATSDDKGREVLHNVFSNGEQLVATDGKRMVVIDAKAGGTMEDPLHYNGETLKNVKDAGTYPQWKQVIPNRNELNKAATLDTGELFKLMTQAKLSTQEEIPRVTLWLDDDGKLGATLTDPNVGEYAGGELNPNKAKLISTFDADLLVDLVKIARGLGHDKVNWEIVRGDSYNHPSVFEAKGMKYILMPIRALAGDGKGTYEASNPAHPLADAAQGNIADNQNAPETPTPEPQEPVTNDGPKESSAEISKATEPDRNLNARHTQSGANVLTPSRALKASAIGNADSDVWHYQGDVRALTVRMKGDDTTRQDKIIAEYNAARKDGWNYTNIRAGSYGTLWVFEKDGDYLTNAGAGALASGNFARPETSPSESGYESLRTRQSEYATKFSKWLSTLPESTIDSASALGTKISTTGIGKWMSVERGKDDVMLWFKGEDGRRDVGIRGETQDGALLNLISLATADKSEPAWKWESKAKEWTDKGTTPYQALVESGLIQKLEAKPTESVKAITNFKNFQDFTQQLAEGKVTADQVKAAWEQFKANEAAIKGDLAKLTKDELKRYVPHAYSSDSKDTFVKRALSNIETVFNPTDSISYGSITGDMNNTRRQAMDEKVALWTDEHIQEKAQERRDAIEARKKALTNPETLDEFEQYIVSKGKSGLTPEERATADKIKDGRRLMEWIKRRGESKLTPEQLAKYDEVRGIYTKADRELSQERQAAVSQVYKAKNVPMTVSKHAHEKRGHDVWIVQMGERVDGDTFKELAQKARQLGGNYSRGWKPTNSPAGFQFNSEESANKFMGLRNGSVDRSEEVQSHREESKGNAATRLRSVADTLDNNANEVLNRDRQTNTASRVRMAEGIEGAANSDLAMAKTLRNLADAIESGEATHLDGIRNRKQVETLSSLARQAQYAAERSTGRHGDTGEPTKPSDIDHAKYPYPYLDRSTLLNYIDIGRKTAGAKLVADRVAKIRMNENGGEAVSLTSPTDIDNVKELSSKLSSRGKSEWDTIKWKFDSYERLQKMGLTDLPSLRAALREFLKYKGERAASDPIKKAERDLVGKNIEGFFPTPPAIVSDMIDRAEIKPGMSLLEPSGGKGDIADAAKAEGANVDVIEVNSSLRDLLTAKGHNVIANDFTEHNPRKSFTYGDTFKAPDGKEGFMHGTTGEQMGNNRVTLRDENNNILGFYFRDELTPVRMNGTQSGYDRVLMNPPFENGQDMAHVMHAYDFLKPGGKLIAVMGRGAFFRSDKKAQEFRAWLKEHDGTSEELPEGSFSTNEAFRKTGTATNLVEITKPETALNAPSPQDTNRVRQLKLIASKRELRQGEQEELDRLTNYENKIESNGPDATAKPGPNENLAGNSGRSGGSSSEALSVAECRRKTTTEINRRNPQIQRLGGLRVREVDPDELQGGIAVNTSTSELFFSPEKFSEVVAKAKPHLKESVFESTIDEELLHLSLSKTRDQSVLAEGDQEAAAFTQLSDKLKSLVEDAYKGLQTDHEKGAEYLRMLSQVRSGKILTEENFEDRTDLVNELSKPQSEDSEAWVKRALDRLDLDNLHPTPPSEYPGATFGNRGIQAGDTVTDRISGKNGTVTSLHGAKAVMRLQEGGNVAVPVKNLDQRAGTLNAPAPLASVGKFVNEDVKPILDKFKVGLPEAWAGIKHVLIPTSDVPMRSLDSIMEMKGNKDKAEFLVEHAMQGYVKAFNKAGNQAGIDFFDAYKTGAPQPSPELQQMADTIRDIDTASMIRAEEVGMSVPWKENHMRVMWKVVPGSTEAKAGIVAKFDSLSSADQARFNTAFAAGSKQPTPELQTIADQMAATGIDPTWTTKKALNDPAIPPGQGNRPMQGSKGMLKRSTLPDMSSGIKMGGVPHTYNPAVMFKMSQVDIQKLINVHDMWQGMKDRKEAVFVAGAFPKLPEGSEWLKDSIGSTYFPAESKEGMVAAGKWAVEKNAARILNNYVSKDHVRSSQLGKGLVWIKNVTTAAELSFSPFHAVAETLEVGASSIGLGLQKMVNGSLAGDSQRAADGLKDLVKGLLAGIPAAIERRKTGDNIIKFLTQEDFVNTPEGKSFIKDFPDAEALIADLFTGGAKLASNQDWKVGAAQSFVDSINSGNYVGAALRSLPALSETVMKPLFDNYIPRLKLATWLKEYSNALVENEAGLKNGSVTRAALSREVWQRVENRLGEMNFDNLFWNRTFKSAMQVMFRSVTWKAGSIAAYTDAFKSQAKEFMDAAKGIPPGGGQATGTPRAPRLMPGMGWLFGLSLLTAALGGVMQQLLTGRSPKNLTDLAFPQIDEKDPTIRVGIPTYIKDAVHLRHSPTGYVTSSLSSVLGRTAELWNNKDFYGVQIHNPDDSILQQAGDIGKHMGSSLLPFSVKGYQRLSDQQVSPALRILSLGGFNPAPKYISQSDAEQKAHDILLNNIGDKVKTKEQFQASQARAKLKEQIKHGNLSGIPAALRSGLVTAAQVHTMQREAKMSPLEASVSRFSLGQVESVAKVASPAEKRILAPVIAQKKAAAAKKATTIPPYSFQ